MSVLAQAQQTATQATNGLAPYAETSPIHPAIIPLVAGIAVAIITMLIVVTARYYDQQTKGFLTVTLLVILAFVLATFASMVYQIPTNPMTEILVGALASQLGAVVSHWVGIRREPRESDKEPENTE